MRSRHRKCPLRKAEEGFHGKKTGHVPAQQDRRTIRRPLGRLVFVVIGLVVVIPSAGAFGILWTLMAVGITGYNAYCAFGKGYVGPEIHIEEDGEDRAPSSGGDSVQQRLQELRNLYDRSLITEEEYEEKRREILKDL